MLGTNGLHLVNESEMTAVAGNLRHAGDLLELLEKLDTFLDEIKGLGIFRDVVDRHGNRLRKLVEEKESNKTTY